MHICPHCQKLGISSFDAMGGAGFSRGLVSCRYCTNTSKRRARPLFYLAVPFGMILFWAMVFYGDPPFPFIFFWFAFFTYLALIVADRSVELDKYEPREKLPDPRTTIAREQHGSASITMMMMLVVVMLAIVPSARADGVPAYLTVAQADTPTWLQPPTKAPAYTLRRLLRIDAESQMNPGFFRSTIQTPCGSSMAGGLHTVSGTSSSGHEWSFDLDSHNHQFQMNMDGNVWSASLDENGNVIELRDPANHRTHHTPATPEQIKAGLAAHQDDLVKAMSGCAAPKPKCLTFDNNSAPTPKDCYGLPDIFDDEGFWESYWSAQMDDIFDVDYLTREQCLAKKATCSDSANAFLGLGATGCSVFWFAAPVAAACGAGIAGAWGYALLRCSQIVC